MSLLDIWTSWVSRSQQVKRWAELQWCFFRKRKKALVSPMWSSAWYCGESHTFGAAASGIFKWFHNQDTWQNCGSNSLLDVFEYYTIPTGDIIWNPEIRLKGHLLFDSVLIPACNSPCGFPRMGIHISLACSLFARYAKDECPVPLVSCSRNSEGESCNIHIAQQSSSWVSTMRSAVRLQSLNQLQLQCEAIC